jgi:hypothetical protein
VIHELKTWPSLFEPVWLRTNLFQLRKFDRMFRTGDGLHLREWDPEKREYSGRYVRARVTYIMHGPILGLKEGWALMSVSVTESGKE